MPRPILPALSLLALALASPPALADCFDCDAAYDACIAADTDGGNRYNCLVHRDSCAASCQGEGGSGRSSMRYGAIARSDSGTLGVSSGLADADAAAIAAVRDCQSNENAMVACPVIVDFHNACGAVAAGTDGSWGSDWGYDAAEAGAKAIAVCRSYGGQDCQVVRWQCSG